MKGLFLVLDLEDKDTAIPRNVGETICRIIQYNISEDLNN